MLSTPGRSPRHFVDSPVPLPCQDEGSKALVPASSKAIMGPPLAKRPRKQIVLDEDTYISSIERIVEREFFPDLPKLQNRLEWLEAVRSGDPVQMREAQMKIIQRKVQRVQAGATPGMIAGTPGSVLGFGTPGSMLAGVSPAVSLARTDAMLGGVGLGDEKEEGPDLSVSLDKFMSKYTSEDNVSFDKIKERDNRKRLEKVKGLLVAEGKAAEKEEDVKAIGSREERPTDGYGTSGQPVGTLISWPHKARNALMYDAAARDDAPLTAEEVQERSMGPPKEVNRHNTRFTKSIHANQGLPAEEAVAILYNPVAGATPLPYVQPGGKRQYDLEDMRRTPQRAAGGGGDGDGGVVSGGKMYEYVATPSPAPGVDASPFMTWGDIASTPLRLEAEDTPVEIGGSADGTHFSILAAAPREETAVNLSRMAARSLKEKKMRQMGAGAIGSPLGLNANSFSPSPLRRNIAQSPGLGVAALSPAAQKLVSKAFKKGRPKVDAHLRASYSSPSPLRPSRGMSVGPGREGSVPPSASPSMRAS